MKRNFLLILPIVSLFALSCEEDGPVVVPTENLPDAVFAQSLEMPLQATRTDNDILVNWTGEDIIEIKYEIFKKSESMQYSDEFIKTKLKQEANKTQLNSLARKGKGAHRFINLEPETEYEVVSLGKNKEGHTKLCRNTQMTYDKLPNNFEQRLSLEKATSVENRYYTTVVANCAGTYVHEAKSDIFIAAESENISDEEIIELLAYNFSGLNLADMRLYEEGCYIYYKNLEVNVEYEVVSYAVFEDGTSKICRDKITTKED